MNLLEIIYLLYFAFLILYVIVMIRNNLILNIRLKRIYEHKPEIWSYDKMLYGMPLKWTYKQFYSKEDKNESSN